MRGIEAQKSKRTGIGGWHTEQEEDALVTLVENLSYPPDEQVVIVELGGEYGRSASEFAWALKKHNYNGHIWTVDTFIENHPIVGNLLEAFTQNLKEAGLINYVTPIRGTTALQAAHWDKPIDLLYIDAGHSYLSVKSDIAAWVGYLKAGGTVVFHDYAKSPQAHVIHQDVKRAVDEWHSRTGWKRVNGPDSLVWFVKPDSPHVERGNYPRFEISQPETTIQARVVQNDPMKTALEQRFGKPERIARDESGPESPPVGTAPLSVSNEPSFDDIQPDYESMKYRDLRNLATERGIKSKKKSEIIEALREQDASE